MALTAIGRTPRGVIILGVLLAHVSIQCADPVASRTFYEAVLAPLGAAVLRTFGDNGDYVGFGPADGNPEFWIGPVNTAGGPHDDIHLAFHARSRDQVHAFVDAARSLGFEVLHEPQQWWYAPNYYGGFVRDPDGNNVRQSRSRPGDQTSAGKPELRVCPNASHTARHFLLRPASPTAGLGGPAAWITRGAEHFRPLCAPPTRSAAFWRLASRTPRGEPRRQGDAPGW